MTKIPVKIKLNTIVNTEIINIGPPNPISQGYENNAGSYLSTVNIPIDSAKQLPQFSSGHGKKNKGNSLPILDKNETITTCKAIIDHDIIGWEPVTVVTSAAC